MKKSILILSAVTAVFVGLDKVGVTPIAPGYDVDFSWARASDSARLFLRSDAGDLDCWIRVKVGSTGVPPGGFRVELTDHRSLAVAASADTGTDRWLEISARSAPDSGSAQRTKFQWPSGIGVVIAPTAGGALTSVLDWQVFLKSDQSDSMSRARRRQQWFWISLFLLLLAAAGGAYGAIPEKPPPVPTPQGLITIIIGTIQGANKGESKRMRRILEHVVNGMSVTDAMKSVRLDPASLDAKTLWFAARGQLVKKVHMLVAQLGVQLRTIQRP